MRINRKKIGKEKRRKGDLPRRTASITTIQISTIIFERGDRRSAIDLMLITELLAAEAMLCSICNQEYGSDHLAIGTEFDLGTTTAEPEPRLLCSNTPAGKGFTGSHQPTTLKSSPTPSFPWWMMLASLEKPSPYTQLRWTQELIELRKITPFGEIPRELLRVEQHDPQAQTDHTLTDQERNENQT